jgi:hypothetical protein
MLFKNDKIDNGRSISFDSTIKVKGTYSENLNDISFYRINNKDLIFEIKKIITNKNSKKYIQLYCIQTDDLFVIEEKTFNLLFYKMKA